MRQRFILISFICLVLVFLGCAAKEVKKAPEIEEVKAELKVEKLVVGTGVEGLIPQGVDDEFPATVGKIYCFSHIKGALSPVNLKHLWFYEGNFINSVTLTVKSSNWRTYSYKTIGSEHKGKWMVKIVDDQGTPLKAVEFEIK